MLNHWINHILRLRSEWTLPFVASLLCCCVTGGPRNITVAPLLYSQCNVLVDASSPWRQKLQHIDITRLTYNALWRHGPGPPRYKEGRLYIVKWSAMGWRRLVLKCIWLPCGGCICTCIWFIRICNCICIWFKCIWLESNTNQMRVKWDCVLLLLHNVYFLSWFRLE